MHFVYLAFAIVAEVIGTSALKASEGFTRLMPSLMVVVSYTIAFFLLGLAIRSMSVGIAYAIWAGLGIVLITVIGVVYFGERLDMPAYIGLALILAGVVVINVFSKTVVH